MFSRKVLFGKEREVAQVVVTAWAFNKGSDTMQQEGRKEILWQRGAVDDDSADLRVTALWSGDFGPALLSIGKALGCKASPVPVPRVGKNQEPKASDLGPVLDK